MNIYIFAIFVIQLLFILISSLLPLLFHLSRIPTYYHFRLSPLFSDIQQHGILLFSLLSAFVPNYIFCLHLTNHLLLLFVFPFLLMSYFLLPFLHFFLFYISFSSYWFSYSSSCTVFSSFLISSLYASPPLTLLCMHSNFYLLLPFFRLLIIVLDLFSSHRNTLSSFFLLLFHIFHCCLAASWKISPILHWIFVSAAVSVSRGHFRFDETISETRAVSLGVKIQI